MTVNELDVHEELKKRGCEILDHNLVSDPARKRS